MIFRIRSNRVGRRLFNNQKFIKRTYRKTTYHQLKLVSKKRHNRLSKICSKIFRNLRQSLRRRNLAQSNRTPTLSKKAPYLWIKWWIGHHYLNVWLPQLRQHSIKIEKLRCLIISKNLCIQERVVHEKKRTSKLGFSLQPLIIKKGEIQVMSQTGLGCLLTVWPLNSKSHNYSHKSFWSL